jgi:serine/threonine protein phosphatase PrpC
VAKAAGCTAVPEIKCTRLEPRVHQYLVLGSDGIWDVIEDEQVTKTVCSNQGDLGAAANSLLQVALQRWSDMNTADNISVIIVSIG